ncbi:MULTISPECIES: hypothetical protein [unclassified Solwaraspora]|uniref:hypothetical protein n=1 Tax=unclassified Solwaraspora TaxID=2627926 RepID=UPI00248ADE1F|nr:MULTISPECIES: hypothetical protein [unclassified Solwaraspora]WBB96067.1 hypothetical protein O7553_22350 [Solwaraspora sp. WMMA2059]WBC20028.1 hypothetical protein O7543_25025 [Solwaraspora sp. WMMA2080]WJK32377.1 hypothetical protein O7610_16495 [Solwaraspora sp. WMMA2065]
MTVLGRFAAGCAATSLAALSIAAPAQAVESDDIAWVSPFIEYVTNIAMDATTPKPIEITISNSVPTAAVDVSVTIDASTVSDAFRIDLPGASQGCTVAGKVATCTLDELAGDSTHVYRVDALPGDLDVLEYSGVIEVTTSAANMPEEQQTTGRVQLTGPGVDLVVGEIDDVTLQPGESTNVPVRAANVGTVAAAGVQVVLSTGLDLELPDRYDNCEYNADFLELTCQILGEVGPGEVFTLHEETPLRVRVGETAPGPSERIVVVSVLPLGDDEVAALGTMSARSAGNELRLATLEPLPDLNDTDNWTEFLVNIPNQPADSVAIGATVQGAVGDVVDIEVGMRNDGPADLILPGQAWAPSAVVTLPVGVEAVAVGDRCAPVVDGSPVWDDRGQPNGLVYFCRPTHSPVAGESFHYPFQVEIVGAAGAAGSIVIDGGVQDPDTDNNTAEITLGSGGEGAGGGLPVTGANAGLLAGVGAVLVVAGAVAVVMFRRRRIVTVVD